MSISKLPQSTCRLLKSTTVVVSPLSLVKELVDNAIDANATNIEVSISANTVDKIQVRDNGHGISPEDYDAVGRKSHTSKLRTFEELQCKGGKTLGFRGDALASMNTCSKLTITTRTSEDRVATFLVLKNDVGGIADKSLVSGPVGTTVDVSDLFAGVPVRRQLTIKESKKSCGQIKDLLHTCALTRPHIRLSLKILKNNKLSWSYAPSKGAHVREAKTFSGITSATPGDFPMRPATPASVLRFEAFLPRAGADLSKISGKGYFISVDSRPMSTSRGTMKKLVNIYKTYIRDVIGVEASSKNVTRPFIRLDIQCIIGSYDPNVTAAKDEVLFANESKVLSLFEDMCKDTYLPPQPKARTEVVEDCNEVDQSRNRERSPHLLSDDDEEQFNEPLQGVTSDDAARGLTPDHAVSVDNDLAGLPLPSSGRHLTSPVDIRNLSTSVRNDIATHRQGPPVIAGNNAGAPCSSPATVTYDLRQATRSHVGAEVVETSRSNGQDQSSPVYADLQPNNEPTQSLVRTGWEVDMARDQTASPEGNTRPILLNSNRSNFIEHLQSQRLDQTKCKETNPWSIAKKAAEKRGAHEGSNSGSLGDVERRDDRPVVTFSCQQLRLPEAEEFARGGFETAHSNTADGHIQLQHYRRHRAPVARREDAYEADGFEPPTSQYPTAPQGGIYGRRHQDRRRTTRDEQPFWLAGESHNVEDLDIQPSRDLGIHQRAYFKTPHPFASYDQESAFGTPPLSSSPLHKPFRAPARVEGSKRRRERQRPRGAPQRAKRAVDPRKDGLRQGKIDFNARRGQESLNLEDPKGDCSAAMEPNYGGLQDGYAAFETSNPSYRPSSGGPYHREMEEALERLHALRQRTENTDCIEGQGQGEQRGRSLSRRSTSTAPDMSPRNYLRRRLASRSQSRNKTHKRMRSEMLPFERISSEVYTHTYSLILDLHNVRKQPVNASNYDLYVFRGQQEAAFPLGSTEMEDISNRLQEVLGAWAYKEHGVELELEIDIGALFEGNDMGCMME
ncbi:DNA mismatch repair protein mutL [Colletotrichum incanum]|nr:DNA mismatch repair protein mutL [Colletotrichum incanum]